jgi:hypothetical protein
VSVKDHRPSDWGNGQVVCIWCHEVWPCDAAKVREETLRETVGELAKEISTGTPEPRCCDTHFAAWDARKDAVETMEEWLAEKLKKIHERVE